MIGRKKQKKEKQKERQITHLQHIQHTTHVQHTTHNTLHTYRSIGEDEDEISKGQLERQTTLWLFVLFARLDKPIASDVTLAAHCFSQVIAVIDVDTILVVHVIYVFF